MKIILGQGNPDLKYANTRHNTGFMVLEALGERHDAVWKNDDQLHVRHALVMIGGEKVLLLKPLTFYNETGGAARALIDYYKVDSGTDLLVIHDDLALPLGTIRVRDKGSDAGNNGVKSLNRHLGDQYHRVRIGIWTEQRERMDDVDFVLSKFTTGELKTLEHTIIPEVLRIVDRFIAGELEPHSSTPTELQ